MKDKILCEFNNIQAFDYVFYEMHGFYFPCDNYTKVNFKELGQDENWLHIELRKNPNPKDTRKHDQLLLENISKKKKVFIDIHNTGNPDSIWKLNDKYIQTGYSSDEMYKCLVDSLRQDSALNAMGQKFFIEYLDLEHIRDHTLYELWSANPELAKTWGKDYFTPEKLKILENVRYPNFNTTLDAKVFDWYKQSCPEKHDLDTEWPNGFCSVSFADVKEVLDNKVNGKSISHQKEYEIMSLLGKLDTPGLVLDAMSNGLDSSRINYKDVYDNVISEINEDLEQQYLDENFNDLLMEDNEDLDSFKPTKQGKVPNYHMGKGKQRAQIANKTKTMPKNEIENQEKPNVKNKIR